MKNSIGLLLCAAAALLLSGCASAPTVVPAPYVVTVVADKGLNPDRNGNATPVQVKLFRVRNINAFMDADFFSLYENGEQTLGADLESRNSLFLQPGDVKMVRGSTKDDDRMLAVFVAYRDMENAVWRAWAPLPKPTRAGRFSVFSPKAETAHIKVHVGAKGVSVEMQSAQVRAPIKADIPVGKRSISLGN